MAGNSRACDAKEVMNGHGNGPSRSPALSLSSKNSFSSPTKKFTLNQDVLARWTDGLFYLGQVTKIDEKNERGYVVYDDKSEHWCLFKDMSGGPQKVGPTLKDIICCLCEGEGSEPPNEIVLCDKCGVGYHQKCHNPTIEDSVLQPGVEWLCRLCVFASSAKKGGAIQKGPKARAMEVMKQTLPYQLNSLSWNEGHNSNDEQLYCYCGGPGTWYMKMLQCRRCRQWFHEACMQCLSKPLIFGDRFYAFVCSVCNSGKEFLHRLPLKWADLGQLSLFHLTIEHNIKYYDLEEQVLPWIEDNLDDLQIGEYANLGKEERKQLLHMAMDAQENAPRFKSGREIKKKLTWYGLRTRLPPMCPKVTIPSNVQITDEVFDSRCEVVYPKRINQTNNTPIPIRYGVKRRASSEPEDDRKLKKAKIVKKKLLSPTSKLTAKLKALKSLKNHRKSSSPVKYNKVNGLHTTTSTAAASPGKSPSKNTLDKFIPRPTNYEGTNHPFKTVLERDAEIEHTKLKERLLHSYATASYHNHNHSEADSESYGDSTVVSETDSDHFAYHHHHQEAAATTTATTTTTSATQGPYVMQVRRRKRGRPSKAEIAALNRISIARAAREKEERKRNPGGRPQKVNTMIHTSIRNGQPAAAAAARPARSSQTRNVLDKRQLDGMSKREVPLNQLRSSVNTYFGAANRLATGETFVVQAKRLTPEGKVQYLVEWEGGITI